MSCPAPQPRQDRDRAAAPDETLLAWAAAGDRLAFDELTLRHLSRVYSIVHRIVRDPAVAEETAQEVMFRAWQHAARFDPGRARFTTWLHRIAVNLALNRARAPLLQPLETVAELADTAAGPEDTLAAKENRLRLHAGLRRLPARQRAALALFYDQALSGAEAAAALSVSPRALEGLLRRARRFLVGQMRDEDG
ncbi:sigma-70 family RNA polymerase sigma factor [Rhodovastum atsumiense]|uniref:sigma-70 family RNA polymerase sigma factor n=1 Tax=Rhodovastum atsumiense TaxID=504468 RepID=UPI00202465FE|nr:sigma-70 family RNA polymerase sigma factor [Rhodovastum atsumiense]